VCAAWAQHKHRQLCRQLGSQAHASWCSAVLGMWPVAGLGVTEPARALGSLWVVQAGGHEAKTGYMDGMRALRRLGRGDTSLTIARQMANPRWYPTVTTLADGKVGPCPLPACQPAGWPVQDSAGWCLNAPSRWAMGAAHRALLRPHPPASGLAASGAGAAHRRRCW
jgi:hypothetical protein